ncbi:MAG: hypothetical protein IPO37_17670 [Saprospiraceae bacterium]|nr:hypothetical protein [Saprospiraceae bacterium]
MQASILERLHSQFIMSTCHGMFSAGLMIGSLMRSLTLLLEMNEVTHMLCMMGISIVIGLWAAKKISHMHLKQENHAISLDKTSKSKKFSLPSGVLLSIIIVVFVSILQKEV